MASIALLRPPLIINKWSYITSICLPIGLAYIASSLQHNNHKVQVIDGIGEAPLNTFPGPTNTLQFHGITPSDIVSKIDPETNIIGISCLFSFEWPVVKDLIKLVRNRFPHVKIILGGEHCTALPEFCLRETWGPDYVVLGEGEDTVRELVIAIIEKRNKLSNVAGIAYLDEKNFIKNIRRARIIDINSIPEPAWDLFPLENYLNNSLGYGVNRGKSMPIIASRGCPYKCTFCSSASMWTTHYLARAPEKVTKEINKYVEKYDVSNIDFYDLTAIVKKSWIVNFCKLLIESNLDITWQLPSGTRHEALDADVMPLLYKSGCRNLAYAPESGSVKILKNIKKNIIPKNIIRSMKSSVKHGIISKANIIFGFPFETKYDVLKSMVFIMRLAYSGVHTITISPFAPYPGSELFTLLRAKNKIPQLNDDYFLSLLSISDLKNNTSYSNSYSNHFLTAAQLIGYLLFFGISFLVRPFRFYVLLRNIVTGKHETRLDKALSSLVFRILHWKTK